MTKADYLSDSDVQAFIQWLAPRLDQPNSFVHSYYHKRLKEDWTCDSLHSAYLSYKWNSKDFLQTKRLLDSLTTGLQKAVEEGDLATACSHCLAVLAWGGNPHWNSRSIRRYGDALPAYLKQIISVLDPQRANTAQTFEGIKMNAGFSKIYSLLLDDFVIYDSRVGAALGMLVSHFCQETGRTQLPSLLCFAYGGARQGKHETSDRRNPGNSIFEFPSLSGLNKTQLHIIHNLWASWLLKEVIVQSTSKFSNLRELEAALFMIGYDVRVITS